MKNVLAYFEEIMQIPRESGKEAIIKKVHACMEGGILSNNIENLDICTIYNCHSINECVSISSINRVYNWLKQTLIKYNLSDKVQIEGK